MKQRWDIQPEPPQTFFDEFPELPRTVASLLYNRSITNQASMDEFLAPDYSRDVHDPFLFRDMKKTVLRLFEAIEKGEQITIHGDYDADGVSASVILTDTLRALGATHLNVYLPHRETDGYGLNLKTIEFLSKNNTKLIITCDCGISNKNEVDLANECGIDVIITDHHSIPELLPNAFAIIHPKLQGETYPFKDLAGGGVAFKLAQAMLHTHKETHERLADGQAHDGFEKWLLDMVAIASVADMVPLLGESRTLTKFGLIVLNKTRRIGMQKLLLEARLLDDDGTMKKEIDAQTIGFRIAPRINAAGRLDHANTAYQLMVTKDGTEAVDLAWQLDQSNNERRRLTDEYVKEAIEQVEREQKNSPVLFVYKPHWTTGVVGLIAGQIKNKYGKPAIAMGLKQDEISGSGRSIKGFNMIETLHEMPHCFSKYGGHPMACGFTLASPDMLKVCQNELIERFNKKTNGIDITPTLDIDAEIELEHVTWELYDLLDKFEPFGQANPQPLYLARGLTVIRTEPVGKEGKHLRILLKHKTNSVRKTIGWSLCEGDTNWGKELKSGDMIDMVFEIGVNEWNGSRDLQMTIVDLRKTS